MKNTENMFNASAPTTPVSRKHTNNELLDILRGDVELSELESLAKQKYGTVLKEAIADDEKQSFETRKAENFVRPAALVSVAVLRALGAMKVTKE